VPRYLSSKEVTLEATIEVKSSIEKTVVYLESAMSKARNGRVDRQILVRNCAISARFSSNCVREKHVFKHISGLPGVIAIAASANVHSSVERRGNAAEESEWGRLAAFFSVIVAAAKFLVSR